MTSKKENIEPNNTQMNSVLALNANIVRNATSNTNLFRTCN